MLQLRCTYCQTPFSLRRDEALIALQEMASGDLTHFDAHCPRCRRANQIPRKRLERAYLGWQQALKELEKEAAQAEKEKVAETGVEKPSPVKKGTGKPAKAPEAAQTGSSPAKKKGSVKGKKPAKPAASPKEKKPAARPSATVKPAAKAKKG